MPELPFECIPSANGKNKLFKFELGLRQLQQLMQCPPDWHDPHAQDGSDRFASSQREDKGFSGLTLKEARDACVLGLPKLYEKCRYHAEKQKVLCNIESIAPIVTYDYSGIAVDVDRYLSNDPECMMSIKDSEHSKVINIAINITVPGYVDQAMIEQRGMVIYSYIRALELAGYQVNVSIVEWSAGLGDHYFYVRIPIKGSGQYLDESLFCYYVSHPSVLRNCFFRINEEFPKHLRKELGIPGSYGRCISAFPQLMPSNEVLIERYEGGSIEGEVKKIKEGLTKQGVCFV